MKPNYVLKSAMELLDIQQLRAHQLKPVQSLMNGDDTVVIARTATGKSVIYQLPALLYENKLALVIEPTLSLIYDQVQSLQAHNIKADYIDCNRKKQDVNAILSKIRKGKLTFLYITPERLQSKHFWENIAKADIHMVVVDECHCVAEWGYTFRDSYLKILQFTYAGKSGTPSEERTFRTCYGDLYVIVNALRDYADMLDSVIEEWSLTGFHAATYELHAARCRKIAGKYAAAIGYDYDKALERCRKRRAKGDPDSDTGIDGFEALIRKRRAKPQKGSENGKDHAGNAS